MSHRIEALAEEIRQTLSQAVYFELRDPGLEGVTITSLRLSPDYQYADVRFTLLSDDLDPAITVRSFNRAKGFLKRVLAKSIKMRRVPELRFHFDEQAIAERRIGEILEDLADTEQHGTE